MNELFGALIVAASVQQMNKTLQSKGFNEYKDLISAIRQLDIEIAIAKDENRPFDEKLKLRNEYIELQKQYEEAMQREKEKERKAGIALVIVIIGLVAIGLIVMAVLLAQD